MKEMFDCRSITDGLFDYLFALVLWRAEYDHVPGVRWAVLVDFLLVGCLYFS